MTKEPHEFLPPAPDQGRGMSDHLNPHTEDLQESGVVDELASLQGAPESLRRAVTQERRVRAKEGAENLTTIVAQREALERAHVDPLTGLRNIEAYNDQMPRIFDRMVPGELTVVFIDLNGLKRANTGKSVHRRGNTYLAAAANAITGTLRPTDIVYRIGGDEILAVLDGPMDEESLAVVNERLTTRGAETISRLGMPEELYLGLSVGSAVKREDDTLDSLVERADVASEQAKEAFYADIQARTGKDLRR